MLTLEQLYEDTRAVSPDSDRPELQYVDRNWIFPHHIDVMLDICDELLAKYDGDEYVCKAAIILHDVGLVYKRDGPSPEGHESRSVEYAQKMLTGHISNTKLNKIIDCIKATDQRPPNLTTNQRIVRTCDGYAKYKTVHYFAKANFAQDFDDIAGWLAHKVDSDYNKIEYDEYKERVKPIRDWVKSTVEVYKDSK
jgi:HD superfamily phosphodiesterase